MPSRRQLTVPILAASLFVIFLFYIFPDPRHSTQRLTAPKPPPLSSNEYDLPDKPPAPSQGHEYNSEPYTEDSEWHLHDSDTEHTTSSSTTPTPTTETLAPSNTAPVLPTSTPTAIIGLIFYGRRDRVSILNCYLKRNLKSNGGVLDGVHFVLNTRDEEDLRYIRALVDHEPSYSLIAGGQFSHADMRFADLYRTIDSGTLYIKMDDDIIYIGPETIPSLVKYTLAHPEYILTTANVVNHALFNKIHYEIGAIHPWLPEINGSATNASLHASNWRPSSLPSWSGPHDYENDFNADPLFKGARWLPVRPPTHPLANLNRTPIAHAEYGPFGNGWHHWQLAAQQHYSLLQNLELDDSLPMYKFKSFAEKKERVSIMFIAIRGSDINDNKPVPDTDEAFFTVDLPRKLGRPVGVHGEGGVAVHYSSSWKIMKDQLGLDWTDVLSRYKGYAEEMICR
ncbi:MAG: hypothetical protein M1814_003690 [Vezdaea aestivalis]|nr:MAG: hypothetical protein M1814_003690 [Vezdaea aestivalis]